MVHQEAAHAGELVGLAREHPDGELLVGQVRAGQEAGKQPVAGLDVVFAALPLGVPVEVEAIVEVT